MKLEWSKIGPAALAAAALAVAGCQADDGGGGALTREAYVEQGNAICTAGNEAIMAAIPMDASGPPTGEAGEELFQSVLTTIDGMLDDLDALEGPEDMVAEMDSVVAEARAIRATVAEGGAEAFFASEEDPWASINPRLEAMGLAACAEDPSAE